MLDDLRKSYLQSQWSPYPSAPPNTVAVENSSEVAFFTGEAPGWIGGKILSAFEMGVAVKDFRNPTAEETGDAVWSSIYLGSIRGQREIKYKSMTLVSWKKGTLSPEPYSAQEVLRTGDDVAVQLINHELKIILLAPNLIAEPLQQMVTLENAFQWQKFFYLIRQYFDEQNFLEVQTPHLVLSPGTELHLEPFSVEYVKERFQRKLFLPTSPEFHLKKLMSQGWGRIFELRSFFRNDEVSSTHWPEFTLCEWYRNYQELKDLAADFLGIISLLKKSNLIVGEVSEPETWSVRQLFAKTMNFNLTPNSTKEDLQLLAQRLKVSFREDDDWSDLFHRLFLQFIEPWLSQRQGPQFIVNWPPEQAALSRMTDEGWADRMEIYWRGLELANGYAELNDPGEQQKRFQKDLKERDRLCRTQVPEDKSLIQSFERGMSPCSGIALGVDRLFMAAKKLNSISEIRFFPFQG
ncbi:MAG: EF-P lysine aminoacylase GenX [Bdellovibrionales bacterium]|nr:EF-P lysine aminoacylase GenX [Bdellovibrionales bacterium]